MNYVRENNPNPARLIESLRYTGYNNYSAIADIVDNAFDADATIVRIHVNQEEGQPVVRIFDNGKGMDEKTLDEALKLGSLTERDPASDLGKFGLGLVTASLSMARRTEVVTKPNGQILFSATDIDHIIRENRFEKEFRPLGAKELTLWKDYGANHKTGTLIILKKLDRLTNRNLSIFSDILRKNLGQIYRYFLKAGKEIWVNEKKVEPIDPLMLDGGAQVELNGEEIEIVLEGIGKKPRIEKVKVTMVILPDFGIEGNESRGIGPRNSGFYVLRNHREIAEAQTLDIFTRHPDLNRFRAELLFSGDLDEEMGINFTKRELNPTQRVTDKLKNELFPVIRSIRGKIKKQRSLKEDSNIQHDESQRVIAEKAKLLRVPPIERELRHRKDTENGTTVEPKNTERQREHFSRSTKEYQKLNCRFEEGHLESAGPIYDCWMEGKKIVIRYNVDHPFYQRFLVENSSDPSAQLSVDFLIFSLASAELRAAHEDNARLIEIFRFDMSTNLRVLLSS